MSQYAIISTGSKQYKVQPKDVIEIERLNLPENTKEVTLDQVLFVRNGEKLQAIAPVVSQAEEEAQTAELSAEKL